MGRPDEATGFRPDGSEPKVDSITSGKNPETTDSVIPGPG